MKFMSLFSFGISMMLTASLAFGASSATPIAIEPAAQSAASYAFKTLSGKGLTGVPSADQLQQATLGTPLKVMMVRLDELKQLSTTSATNPERLLHDLETLVYPVQVAGNLQGELVLGKVAGTWSTRSVAGPSHLRQVERIQAALTQAAGISASAMLLVRIPALNLECIGYRSAKGLQLAPLMNVPSAGLVAGDVLPAQQLFERVLPLALQHNGQPS